MIWFILINIVIFILFIYVLARHYKLTYNVSEVTINNLSEEYGVLCLFGIVPFINAVTLLIFVILVLFMRYKNIRIL